MFRGAQPDVHAIRGFLPRGSGRSRRAVGEVGSTRDANHCARDGVPVAPVSGGKQHPAALVVCGALMQISFVKF